MSLKLKLKKYSPEIMLGTGIGAIIVGTVMFCKRTPKAVEILKESEETLSAIHEVQNKMTTEIYSEKDFRKDITLTYVQTTGKLIKHYAPAAAVMLTGIGLVCGSHHILNKRNAALTAAYTLASQGYSEYRKKVIEKFGEDVDRQLKYSLVEEETEEKFTDEKGKEKTKKEKKTVIEDIKASPYAKFFDSCSRCWDEDPEANLYFLKLIESDLNLELARKRVVFLNEVYDKLDIPRTKAGQVVGWVYNPGTEPSIQIDLGYDKQYNKRAINGYENVFIIDPNVQGDVLSNL